MENPNYIYNIQVNLVIMKEDNPSLMEGQMDLVKEKLDLIKKDLFEKVNDFCVMEETHKFTVNILGAFEPYHYDRRKWNDSLMKYENSSDWVKGETKEIVLKAFKGIKVNIFVGNMKFEKLE